MVSMTTTWRRWLRGTLVATAAAVLLTAAGVVPGAADALHLVVTTSRP
jgi:hypothetical protein